ncbi:MAG: tetratricopeptide repeat protein [Bacteroidia bacterium]|nr:tetratricopeptide repeat protein [Bacteroidia bacterium]
MIIFKHVETLHATSLRLYIIIFLCTNICFAQIDPNDSQLALEYYKNKEFDKAAALYDKLFKNTNSPIFFEYYIQCLIELDDYKTAEKAIKKQINKNQSELAYYIEFGGLYKSQGKNPEMLGQYEEVIKKLQPSTNQIINIANTFIRKGEFDYAEKAYLKGRKLLKGAYDFNMELASVYQYTRNYQQMLDEYLDLLVKDDNFIQSVQNRLQNIIYEDPEGSLEKMLKTSLLIRIQKYPNKSIFCELLIWLYIQERDFHNAMLQSQALDKRFDENGERLIVLGQLALANEAYDIAVESYKYVINLGVSSPFYLQAKFEFLSSLYQKITKTIYKKQDLLDLEINYLDALKELGETKESFNIIKELAHLQAFYLDKPGDAIERLNRAIKISGIGRDQLAEAKLELADVLLYDNQVYDAIIMYAQIENQNRDNPIGYEAQFRKAKVAYYTGNFKWAQAQLDVLKASTSKLIANDAFELSQLISDNTALDTTEIPMTILARGDLLLFRNKDSLAVLTFDTILQNYSTHSLSDEILFRKAKVFQKNGNYSKAAEYLQQIVNNYAYDILGDDATYYLAQLNEIKFRNKEKAMALYKTLLLNYPGSIYVVDARKKYRILRGEEINTQEKPERNIFME